MGQQKCGLGVEVRDVERTWGSRKRRGFDVRDAGNGRRRRTGKGRGERTVLERVEAEGEEAVTPSKDDVELEARSLREHSHPDEHVEVEGLHEDPHVVGPQNVVKHREEQLALPVLATENGNG